MKTTGLVSVMPLLLTSIAFADIEYNPQISLILDGKFSDSSGKQLKRRYPEKSLIKIRVIRSVVRLSA